MDLPPPPPGYEQTIQAIEGCGVARSKIRIKYEDYLQSDEVTISDIGEVTDAKLRCIRKAVHPLYILTLAKLDQRNALDELSWKDDRPDRLLKAGEGVRSQDKTAKIPVFDENEGVETFARALERSCDLKAGTVFVANTSRFLALQPSFLQRSGFEQSGQATKCVSNMIAVSNADEHGIRFGFIGNEAVPEEKK